MELNSANSIDQSDRIPLHIMRDEVDRSVAGLQNTVIKSSVLARKWLIILQLFKQFVNEFILIFRFSLATF